MSFTLKNEINVTFFLRASITCKLFISAMSHKMLRQIGLLGERFATFWTEMLLKSKVETLTLPIHKCKNKISLCQNQQDEIFSYDFAVAAQSYNFFHKCRYVQLELFLHENRCDRGFPDRTRRISYYKVCTYNAAFLRDYGDVLLEF